MKFCPNCGQQVDNDLLFCENCGASLNAPAAEPAPAPTSKPEPAPVAEPTPAPSVEPVPAPMPDPYVTPMPDPYATPVPAEPTPVVEPAAAPVVEPIPVAVPAPVAAAPAATSVRSNSKPEKKKSSALPVITVIIAVLLLASLAVNALFVWPGFLKNNGSSNGKDKDEKAKEADEDVVVYQDAIDKIEKVINGDITEETMSALMTDAAWEYHNVKVKKVDESRKKSLSNLHDDIEPEDLTYTIEVDESKEIDEDDLEDLIISPLEEIYDEKYEVSAAYEVTLITKLEFDLESVEDEDAVEEIEKILENSEAEHTLFAVEIDDEWYFVTETYTFDGIVDNIFYSVAK